MFSIKKSPVKVLLSKQQKNISIILVAIMVLFQSNSLLAAFHEKLISAEIQLRNNSSFDVKAHSCTAYRHQSINRCYLVPKQNSVLRTGTLTMLGEALNKNLPAKGYIRLNADSFSTAMDLHYAFSSSANTLSLELRPANQDATLPVIIDPTRNEPHLKDKITSTCGLQTGSRYIRFSLKKRTTYNYQCIVTLIDNPTFLSGTQN